MIIGALVFGYVVGMLAGVALAWGYARREGYNAGQLSMVRLRKLTVEEAAGKIS